MGKAFFTFIAAVFSLYRMASLLSSEEGPYLPFLYKDKQQTGVFEWLRMRLGAYNYGPDGRVETNLGRGIACPLCTAAYIGVPLTIFIFLFSKDRKSLGNPILFWLSVWGFQTFLENLTSDDAIKEAIGEVADSLEE